jgi:hypothetical protein
LRKRSAFTVTNPHPTGWANLNECICPDIVRRDSHMPSALPTASAAADIVSFAALYSQPHTIAVYASRWSSPSTTQHSLPGGCDALPGPDIHRLENASLLGGHAHLTLGAAHDGRKGWRKWSEVHECG